MYGRFQFNPLSFVRFPSLSWKAVIKTSGIDLELLILA